MTIDDELTILLTLKGRTAFTRRWMAYAEHVRLPFRVFIADGGTDTGIERLLCDQSIYPHVNYEYVRYPPDNSRRDFYAKVEDALARINTPFVAMADNDDFFFVDGLRDAVRFLSTHAEHATCGGRCAIFWINSSTPTGEDGAVYGDRVDWKCTWDPLARSDKTALDRVRNPLLFGPAIYHHVRRTGEVRRHFGVLRDHNVDDLFLHEQLVNVLTAIAGRSKVLDSLYVARQWNTAASSAQAHLGDREGWLGCMLAPTWSADFGNYLCLTSRALAERDGLTQNEARGHLLAAYRHEMAPALLGEILSHRTINISLPLVVRGIRRLLALSDDSRLKRIARGVYRRMPCISTDVVHGTQMRGRRVPGAAADIQPILAFLTSRQSSGARADHHGC